MAGSDDLSSSLTRADNSVIEAELDQRSDTHDGDEMTKNKESRTVTENGPSVQPNQEHLVKSGSLPTLNNSEKTKAGKIGLLRWHMTKDKFSPAGELDGVRSMA